MWKCQHSYTSSIHRHWSSVEVNCCVCPRCRSQIHYLKSVYWPNLVSVSDLKCVARKENLQQCVFVCVYLYSILINVCVCAYGLHLSIIALCVGLQHIHVCVSFCSLSIQSHTNSLKCNSKQSHLDKSSYIMFLEENWGAFRIQGL